MIHGAPITAPDGSISSFIATIVDVTAERSARELLETAQEQVRVLNAQLEARVLQRTRELAASNAQLEAFCYTVSHDLKAPLRSICSFAQILEEDLAEKISPECLHGLRAVSQSALRMDQLLRDLLDFTRISRCELALRPLDAAAVLRKLVADQFPGANIVLVEPLPVVLAHDVALEQVLTNLLANALKFARPNVEPRIVIRGQHEGPRCRLTIEDNGIGIAPEHRERIFRLFERLHSQHEFPGTGVGLAIVKSYIEKMGGAVGLESEPGQGSRFWIQLRRAP
jgi:signal transduction histidine kinase